MTDADQQTMEGSEVDQDVEAPVWETGGAVDGAKGLPEKRRKNGSEAMKIIRSV